MPVAWQPGDEVRLVSGQLLGVRATDPAPQVRIQVQALVPTPRTDHQLLDVQGPAFRQKTG